MKKRVSVLLLLSCLFMTACGRSEDTDTEPTKVPNPISTSKVTEAPIEKEEASVTEAPTSAPAEIPPESINPLYQFSYRWEDMTVQFPGWFSEYYALGADLYELSDIEKVENIKTNVKVEENKETKKICIYAGGLYEKYGVLTLIKAFENMDLENCELHIYGYGELEQYLLKNKIKNVIFFKQKTPSITKYF